MRSIRSFNCDVEFSKSSILAAGEPGISRVGQRPGIFETGPEEVPVRVRAIGGIEITKGNHGKARPKGAVRKFLSLGELDEIEGTLLQVRIDNTGHLAAHRQMTEHQPRRRVTSFPAISRFNFILKFFACGFRTSIPLRGDPVRTRMTSRSMNRIVLPAVLGRVRSVLLTMAAAT